MDNALTIVMYHYVRPIERSYFPGFKGLELDLFQLQLDWLSRRYSIISVDDMTEFVKNGVPMPEKPCLLTFDDGYKDHFDYVYPELLKRGLKGCFFPPAQLIKEGKVLDVNKIQFVLSRQQDESRLIAELRELMSSFHNEAGERDKPLMDFDWYWHRNDFQGKYDSREVLFFKRMLQYALPLPVRSAIVDELFLRHVTHDEREFASRLYMTIDDIKEMVSMGMSFGGHGCRHMWLNKESVEIQTEEINLSIQFLSDIGVSTTDWIMCYPYGAYDARTLEILKRRNCLFGLTTKPVLAILKQDVLLELGRFDTNYFPQRISDAVYDEVAR